MADKAKSWIENLVKDVQVGEVYEGTVTDIMKDRMRGNEIGAIVELLPGKDGMVHVSNIAMHRVENVSDVLKVGDKVKVKVMEVDKERGRVGLSMKALDPNYVPEEARPARRFGDSGPRGSRPPHHGGFDRGGRGPGTRF
jgi:polyribonucleotide nucleotidyltransferase